ncbi:hypothetical protein CHS0354_009569 [Potamilus streckersoni]|uniref:Transmembrane protein 26 n=1 Tax=Potamilus streckersoni TaxID=2493646 RepID=A0AAE0SPL7_9BIVA|nr:hypothetical protein CHS0354_009569 [Potamilus streckersoni]
MGMREQSIFRSRYHKFGKISRAMVARALLLAHAGIVIWLTTRQLDDKRYYGILAIAVPLFIMETSAVLYFRQGLEWKRFCPAFIAYFASIVPGFWFQRLNSLGHYGNNVTSFCNRGPKTDDDQMGVSNTGRDDNKSTQINLGFFFTRPDIGASCSDVISMEEESMLILIIVCRWLMPRGHLNRNGLSQLLLMYLGICADIIDFSEYFENGRGTDNKTFVYTLLCVWTWCLMQFTLVVTSASQTQGTKTDGLKIDLSDIFSLMMVLFMQDGPFFVIRTIIIIRRKMLDFKILFYYCKNILTLILAIYRLLVLCSCVSFDGDDLVIETVDIQCQPPLTSPSGKGKKGRTRV